MAGGLVTDKQLAAATSEYDYHNRMDAHHTVGGDQWWNNHREDIPRGWVTRG